MRSLVLLTIIGVLMSIAPAVNASQDVKSEKHEMVFGVFRADCYTKFTGGDFSDMECVKFSFSKIIGFAIISGSFILKLPQIIKIVKSGSVEGLGVMPVYIECFNFAITAATSIHLGLPFSVYGETLTIIVQNMIIIMMIWSLNTKISLVQKVIFLAAYGGFCAVAFDGTQVPETVWAVGTSVNIFLNVTARTIQIIGTFQAGSTGQLAFVTFLLAWAGGAARLATVLLESDDFMYRMQFIVSFVLQCIIMSQFAMYWNSGQPKKRARAKIVKRD